LTDSEDEYTDDLVEYLRASLEGVEAPAAERITQIPTKAQHDDLVLKVSPATVPTACSSLAYPAPFLRQDHWLDALFTDLADEKVALLSC